jgi:V8-like Glu-specific endopeptidase
VRKLRGVQLGKRPGDASVPADYPQSCGPMRRLLVRSAALLVLLVLAVAPGAAVARDPGAAAAAAEQARVEQYWTADRMARAIPRDAVLAGSTAGGSRARLQPLALGDVTGASWTAGGAILQRSGKIFFTFDFDYVCSGSVIQDGADPAYSLVITAGHCVYDQANSAFATNWIYVPAWDSAPILSCSSTAYGCWLARAFVVRGEFIDEPGLNLASIPHDYAIAVIGPGGKSVTQVDALGAYPLRTEGTSAGSRVNVFGYPAATPYSGNDLAYCAGAAGVASDTGDWGLTCDMTNGASGGPWLYGSSDPANGTGELMSVNSYRMQGDAGVYGPRFDGKTQAVYTAAAASTPDAVGIDQIVIRPPTPFTDIAGTMFEADIEWVYVSGITSGCSATLYCPDGLVTREQMASFLARALHLAGAAPDAFTDDETSIHEPNINLVAQAGITSGCTATTFCPSGLVTREQMASFLARALHLAGAAPDAFTDDETSIHEPNINLVAQAGITTGCGGSNYCPTANVTRGQMAAFLHRAFGP